MTNPDKWLSGLLVVIVTCLSFTLPELEPLGAVEERIDLNEEYPLCPASRELKLGIELIAIRVDIVVVLSG